MIHKPVVKGSGHSFVGKIQRTLEGFLDENEEGKEKKKVKIIINISKFFLDKII